MANDKTKLTVGIFVACGICIALMAIIWLGMSRFLQKGNYYLTFFDESVQGLDIDAPVKYRGVSIGRVAKIGVAPDSQLIQVLLKIESGQGLERDIVAQLRLVGITGSVFIELDRKAKGEPDRSPARSFPSEYPVVASKPSDISELLRGIDDVLYQISSLDLEGISGRLKLSLDNLSRMIADTNVKAISDDIQSFFESADRILDNKRWERISGALEETTQSLNPLINKAEKSLTLAESSLTRVGKILSDNEKTIKEAIGDFRQAIVNANTLLGKGSSMLSTTDNSFFHLKRHMLLIARNLETASENLNRLTGLLADQPSQLIFGESPIPRKVEPEVGRE